MILNGNCLIIAHRGASAFAPENTMSAFRKAVELKADAIEFDVKLTIDGKMVIIHDQLLDRTTNGSGKVIDCTYEELKRLDAGSFFSEEFKGEKIPLLQDVLEQFSDHLIINIEITNYKSANDGLAEKIANLVKIMGVEKRVFFSSFMPKNLKITSEILPEVPAALLTLPGLPGLLTRSRLFYKRSPQLIHPFFKDVNEAYVKKQHAIGRKVNVWTVNEKEDIQEMIYFGVDGLITDDPVLARNLVEAK